MTEKLQDRGQLSRRDRSWSPVFCVRRLRWINILSNTYINCILLGNIIARFLLSRTISKRTKLIPSRDGCRSGRSGQQHVIELGSVILPHVDAIDLGLSTLQIERGFPNGSERNGRRRLLQCIHDKDALGRTGLRLTV